MKQKTTSPYAPVGARRAFIFLKGEFGEEGDECLGVHACRAKAFLSLGKSDRSVADTCERTSSFPAFGRKDSDDDVP